MDSLPTLQPKRLPAGFLARRDVPDTPLPFDFVWMWPLGRPYEIA